MTSWRICVEGGTGFEVRRVGEALWLQNWDWGESGDA